MDRTYNSVMFKKWTTVKDGQDVQQCDVSTVKDGQDVQQCDVSTVKDGQDV